MQRRRLSTYALFGLLSFTGAARAQTDSAPSTREQIVEFDDDLLAADLQTPFGDPVFSGHLRPSRVLLIRPRTSFVSELCESVNRL
jgi:hypothetical protein